MLRAVVHRGFIFRLETTKSPVMMSCSLKRGIKAKFELRSPDFSANLTAKLIDRDLWFFLRTAGELI